MVTITRSLIADLHVTAYYASELCLAQWHRLASRAAILRIQSSMLPALRPSSYASIVAAAVYQASTSHVYLYLLTSATYTDKPPLHAMLYHPAV